MTLEQKQAIQTVIVDEITRRQQENPTLLIDSLLYSQGPQFVHSLLHAAWSRHTQSTNLLSHLLKALQADVPRATEPAGFPEQPWPRAPIEPGNGAWEQPSTEG